MNKMIGFCGLSCTECPAFLAMQKDDDREREIVTATKRDREHLGIVNSRISQPFSS